MQLTGKTRVYGIIGDPVAHSLSPVFQNHCLQEQSLDAVYLPFHVPVGSLQQALQGLWSLGVAGVNITVPHKEEALDLLEADATARLIGAVNTLKRGEHGWLATNTDWLGVVYAVQRLLQGQPCGSVLLLGAGGTSRAVLHALHALSCPLVQIANRSEGRLSALLEHAKLHYPQLVCEPCAWQAEAIASASAESTLIINTTSIGLEGSASYPFAFSGHGVAFDAVYSSTGETPMLHQAQLAGRRSCDGLPMLIAQGTAAYRFWHGVEIDTDATLQWMQARLGRSSCL